MSSEQDIVALIREKDTFAKKLGIEILEAAEGHSHVTMELGEDTANALGNAHGGVIFSLADLAFASACNSEGIMSVGVEVSMQYMAPCPSSGRLDARAENISNTKRLGFFRIEVFTPDETIIAVCQAIAYRML